MLELMVARSILDLSAVYTGFCEAICIEEEDLLNKKRKVSFGIFVKFEFCFMIGGERRKTNINISPARRI